MTRFVGTPLRGIEFSGPSDEAFSARVNEDTQPRIRIDAGGRITWSGGSSAGDTVLFRDGENSLTTYDLFTASAGLVTVTTDGPPSALLPDGAIAVDTTNSVFYFRSDGEWTQVSAAGGATLTVSDTPPTEELTEGDLWYESDTGKTFVYYDSFWVEVANMSSAVVADSISGNAATATKLQTARSISLSGDLSGSASFDGSSNISISASVDTAIFPETATPGTTTSTSDYIGYIGLPQNIKAVNYELVAADQGKHIYITSTSTVTVPANSSVSFPIGSVVTVIAGSGATATIAITSDTMYLAGTGSTGSRTLAPFGIATLVKVDSTTWFINGTGLS